MNWSKIEPLLAECQKGSSTSIIPNNLAFGDYREFLQRYNGLEGFVATDQYLVLWGAEKINDLNISYQVAEFAPGIILVGTDGSATGYGRDTTTGAFGSVPLVGMSRMTFKKLGNSFEEFLAKIARA